MSEQIVIGKLRDPKTVETETGEVLPVPLWHKRAMWSYLRLVHGRKIDNQIKANLEAQDMIETFDALFIPNERQLQFIMSAGIIKAVATTKHLLINSETVYSTAEKILGVALSSSTVLQHGEGLDGMQAFVKEVGGLKIGLQVAGGTITTRFAIRVGSFVMVELCFNPLSWLGVSGLGRFGMGNGSYERVLRIHDKTELEPRLKTAIENSVKKVGDIEKRITHSKKQKVKRTTAEIVMSAMGYSYGLGNKTLEQVFQRMDKEDPTQWGLAMSSSWVAKHRKEFRKEREDQKSHVAQKLSTISGATLLIDDIPKAEQKSVEWLREHVKSGQLKNVKDLLGRLP